jgi:predicted nucleic acid-binding protein
VSPPHDRPTLLVALDTMVFVYHFEANEEFGARSTELLRRIEDGELRAVCSVLSRLEVLVVPKREGRDDLCRIYREVFETFPNLLVRPVDARIADLAADLRASYSLRTPDALHIATALDARADFYVTEDRRLPGEIEEMRLVGLSAFDKV